MEDIMQGTGNTTDGSSSGNVPLELPTDVRWGFTREGLYAYRHQQHWIASSKGTHGPFMNDNWPGLSWNEAAALLREAGVWIKDSTHFSGNDVRADIKEFHILHDGTTRIMSFAENEALPTATPSRWQGGGFNVKVTAEMLETPESIQTLSEQLVAKLFPNGLPHKDQK